MKLEDPKLSKEVEHVLEECNLVLTKFQKDSNLTPHQYQETREVLCAYLATINSANAMLTREYHEIKLMFDVYCIRRKAEIRQKYTGKKITKEFIDNILMQEETANYMRLICWDFIFDNLKNKTKEISEYINACASGIKLAEFEFKMKQGT